MSTPNRAPSTGALAERVTALMGAPCRSIRSIAGGSICRSFQLVGDAGQVAFAKWLPDAPVDLFAAEAESLRWLRAAGAVEIPEVLGVDDEAIALTWIEQAPPTSARAAAFGRALAAMHAAGASGFGAGWTAYTGAIASRTDRRLTGRPFSAAAGSSRCCGLRSIPAASRRRSRSNGCSPGCRCSSTRASRRRGCTVTCGQAMCCSPIPLRRWWIRRPPVGTARWI